MAFSGAEQRTSIHGPAVLLGYAGSSTKKEKWSLGRGCLKNANAEGADLRKLLEDSKDLPSLGEGSHLLKGALIGPRRRLLTI